MTARKGGGKTPPVITAAMVQDWFKKATEGKSIRPPDLIICAVMAANLQLPWVIKRGERPRPLGMVESTAPAFLKQLSQAEDNARAIMKDPRKYDPAHDWNAASLASIKKRAADLQQKITVAKDALEEMLFVAHDPWWDNADRDSIILKLQEMAVTAWKQSGQNPQTSVRPNDPVCHFVYLALCGLGFGTITEHTVSSILRRRRGRYADNAK